MCRYRLNQCKKDRLEISSELLAAFRADDIRKFHQSIGEYQPTPTHSLQGLADELGIGRIWVKDESSRFGLKAFKGMGASYAIYRHVKEQWETKFGGSFEIDDLYDRAKLAELQPGPFCTATDGNHGRAVAWFSRLLGQQAFIYMPKGTADARLANIRSEGAEVTVIDGDYDEAVRRIARDAKENGWQMISDTAYPGYTQVPRWIMAGYTTMLAEMELGLHPDGQPEVDIVILPAGVGSFAAAALWYYYDRYADKRPRFISVEPAAADCFLESIISGQGQAKRTTGKLDSIMAGLNCGTPSVEAWPLMRDGIDLFLAISDRHALKAMRRYYYATGNDRRIISGESGAAGLAALLALMNEPSLCEARDAIGLDRDARVLVFNTEGDTDPDYFRKVIAK